MSKTYKRFFKIEEQHQHLIEQYFKLKKIASAKAKKFIAKYGVKDIYCHGKHVSFVTFIKEPDMTIWKKSGEGCMPRAKHKSLCAELNDIQEPSSREIVIAGIFGNEMRFLLMGTPKPKGGIPMYSAQFYGNESGYFIQLPWTDEQQDRDTGYLNEPIPDGLTEVKEWEVLKSIDEAS